MEDITYLKRESQVDNTLLTSRVIRLRPNEFKYACSLDQNGFLTHFNLQNCGMRKGELYLMPLIVSGGYYKQDGTEVLPKLDFNGCPVVECVSVREHVEYTELTSEDFEHTKPDLTGIRSLQRDILNIYSQSMPDLLPEEILNMGVSVTKLKILGKLI